MEITSALFSGLPTHILSQVEQILAEPVSREMHAFCHLSLPDAPAATELLRLSKTDLLHLNRTCKQAIDQWCGCARDYLAQPDGPSLTTRSSTLIRNTKDRDRHCVITNKVSEMCHGAHIFPYALGRTQEKAELDIWKVLEMFWGAERKDQLLQLIFGQREKTNADSKTQINALCNMITLSPDAHSAWAKGQFTLEPLGSEAEPYEISVTLEYVPRKSGSTMQIRLTADPNTELVLFPDNDPLFSRITLLPIWDGHIVTFKTDDPINAPLPHRDLLMLQCFLTRVMRMAGRAGEDMLETFDTDDEVTSLAASNTASTEEQIAHEPAQSPLSHGGTTNFETPPLESSPDAGINIATVLEQSPPKKRRRLFSRKSSPNLSVAISTPLEPPRKKRRRPFSRSPQRLSCVRSFLAYLNRKNNQNRKAKLFSEKNVNVHGNSQVPEPTLQVRPKPIMVSS